MRGATTLLLASGSCGAISGSFSDKQEASFEAVPQDVLLHPHGVEVCVFPFSHLF